MKKYGLLAGLVAVALLLGMAGTAVRSDRAQAMPDDVVAISCKVLAAGIDGNLNDNTIMADDFTDACNGLTTAEIANLAAVLGDEDDELEASDLPESPTQLIENAVPGAGWPFLYIMAFVDDDDTVTFDLESDGGEILENAAPGDWVCNLEAEDDDCDASDADPDNEDGVVVARLYADVDASGNLADRGDYEVEVDQEGEIVAASYTVVGEPDDISLLALKEIISEEIADSVDCRLSADDITDDGAEPDKTILVAVVTDDDGTALYDVGVEWATDDDDVVALGSDIEITGYDIAGPVTWTSALTLTKLLSTGDIAALNVGCGGDVGVAEITATSIENGYTMLTPATWPPEVEDATLDITVIGVPDVMTLKAEPAAITCDGASSSTVTATVLDSEGNNVVDGTDVRFEVVALGTADPITATTTDGVATSKVTPLSGMSAGVVVVVTVGDLEGNVRIDCSPAPAPPPVAPPVSPTGPTVVPPGTGDGGYLP